MEKTTGFATMAELRRAALWLGDYFGWKVIIEGVTHVSPTSRGVFLDAPPVSSTNKQGGQNITPQKPQFTFKRSKGMAFFSDLESFGRWAREQLALRMESNDLTGSGGNPESAAVAFKMNPSLI